MTYDKDIRSCQMWMTIVGVLMIAGFVVYLALGYWLFAAGFALFGYASYVILKVLDVMEKHANITGKYILIGQTPVPEPDLLTWAMWLEKNWDHRVVAQTDIGALRVSTVFLGLDYRWVKGPHEPLLFETMIFTDGKPEDYQERCSTWLEAEAQHARAVEKVTERIAEGAGDPMDCQPPDPKHLAARGVRKKRGAK